MAVHEDVIDAVEGKDLNIDLPLLLLASICFFFEFAVLLTFAFLHELVTEEDPYDLFVLHVADELPDNVR